jgi:hypothetical protein
MLCCVNRHGLAGAAGMRLREDAMSRTVVIVSLAAGLLAAAGLAPPSARAIEPGSAACKRELQATHKKMQESLAVIDSVKDAPRPAKCPAYSAASELAEEIRESSARCVEAKTRTSAVRDADDVIEAIDKAYKKWCPPRPGMVRVKMTFVKEITRDELPKPLAAVHTCGGDGKMFSANERFDLGRLVMLGCPGNANPSAEQIQARNAKPDLLKKEQVALYVTRDRDGDDPRRLTFPILTADGKEGATDLLAAGRNYVGDKLDEIASYWEPAKEGVCRVHVIWRVTAGKAKLVLWQEATDCSKGNGDFKTVLDKR